MQTLEPNGSGVFSYVLQLKPTIDCTISMQETFLKGYDSYR